MIKAAMAKVKDMEKKLDDLMKKKEPQQKNAGKGVPK